MTSDTSKSALSLNYSEGSENVKLHWVKKCNKTIEYDYVQIELCPCDSEID